MKTGFTAGALVLALSSISSVTAADDGLSARLLGTYRTGLADVDEGVSSGETVALRGTQMYVTNADDVSLDIVDVADPAAPRLVRRVPLAAYGSSANSVDVSDRNVVAVALAAAKRTDPGTVVLLTPAGQVKRTVVVGSNPDMVVFTRGGDRLLVANEGEPDCYGDGCTDPEGSVSVVEMRPIGRSPEVHTIGFGGVAMPPGVRIFGPGASVAQDLEPEYIAVSDDGDTAWVSLQENNAVATLDLRTLTVANVTALGVKDHGVVGQGLGPSDRDGAIDIRPWRHVFGMYMPDAIAQFQVDGETYLVTANEGDAREYDGFEEEQRARSLAGDHPSLAGIAGVDDDAALGRLTVTNAPPDGDFDHLYAFGARSVSIWHAASGGQIWDSGDEIERLTAQVLPDFFNSNNDENEAEGRSDNKGPEPEGVAVGRIHGRSFAFVGLERIGGVVVYDVSSPHAPQLVDYLVTRDFSRDVAESDSGPEVLRFVEARRSPTGRPLLVVANEITGTVNLWALDD